MNFVERAFIPGIEDSGRPVELLRDHRGIYGIGVSDAFDLPALAWRCGIDNDYSDVPRSVILRPDKLSDLDQHFPRDCAVLQKITGGFRRGPFMNSREEYLRQFNHHEALRRAGLSWPPYDQGKYRWWSNDKGQQMRNRQIYHGLRLLSLHAINSLIGRAIEQCADREALQAARRFAFEHRQRIYRAVARSHRALQLTRSFPLLALCIYSFVWPDCPIDMSKKEIYERRRHAAALIERGVKLRDVAGFLGVPMALRHLKPGVAHLASSFIIKHPGLLAFMPNTVPRARVWLHLVKWGASDTRGLRDEQDDFAAWIARNVQRIPGNRDEIFGFLSDRCDWVRASTADRRFITRPFKPSMSIKTVTALSDKWHEAVVNYMTGPDIAFPEPWFPSAKCGDYDIVPIDNSADLYREGHAMHHCVGTYADRVQDGSLYVYSIRRDGKRVATLALERNGKSATISEFRGSCNARPSTEIVSVARKWLQTNRHREIAAPVPQGHAAKFRFPF